MMKKFGAFCLVVLLVIYVVKNPTETVDGVKFVVSQLAVFVEEV